MEPFTIGDVIRKLRDKKGWSQERLGEEAKHFVIAPTDKRIDKTTISRIENGETLYTCEFGTIWRLARALHVTIGDLEAAVPLPFLTDHGRAVVEKTRKAKARIEHLRRDTK